MLSHYVNLFFVLFTCLIITTVFMLLLHSKNTTSRAMSSNNHRSVHGMFQEQLQFSNGSHLRQISDELHLRQLRSPRWKQCNAKQYQWHLQPIREWYKLCQVVDLDKYTFHSIRPFHHLLQGQFSTSPPNHHSHYATVKCRPIERCRPIQSGQPKAGHNQKADVRTSAH